jgi:hypothetical protein
MNHTDVIVLNDHMFASELQVIRNNIIVTYKLYSTDNEAQSATTE